jgi:hypothetical protein
MLRRWSITLTATAASTYAFDAIATAAGIALAASGRIRPRPPALAPDRGRRGLRDHELAKEAPYYAGAFGAAIAADSVSANDALIFLGGANLGAALYEYGLARLTRAFLSARAT